MNQNSAASASGHILSVSDLTVRFGGILALDKVSFEVRRDSITGLIGPNGAGKTTVFNCLTGFYRATAGGIRFKGKDGDLDVVKVLGEPLIWPQDLGAPQRLLSKMYYKMFGGSFLVARAGIARTFQNIRLFRDMTVIENLLVAQHEAVDRKVFSGVVKLPSFQASEEQALSRAFDWLKVFGLMTEANRLAGELPYGQQRRLEIARALCTNPALVCLDEPAAGLNPIETAELSELIQRIRNEFGVTVLVIEHDMSLVMGISDEVVVLNYGQVIAHGHPEAIKEDPAVLTAYLGSDE